MDDIVLLYIINNINSYILRDTERKIRSLLHYSEQSDFERLHSWRLLITAKNYSLQALLLSHKQNTSSLQAVFANYSLQAVLLNYKQNTSEQLQQILKLTAEAYKLYLSIKCSTYDLIVTELGYINKLNKLWEHQIVKTIGQIKLIKNPTITWIIDEFVASLCKLNQFEYPYILE
jgi:hypothetical protein